ncbi:MAG: 3-methyladenine DNA glycosylase [Nautiliaceae bacterium]
MEFSNSYELLIELEKKNLLKNSPKFWWPGFGTFEVVIGAILTQNTKWENVEKALKNLKGMELEDIACMDWGYLAELIKPVGFYNQKSKRLILLSKNILRDFGDFETFQSEVDREWLLNQKGVGFESADAILCYACKKEVMVVDAYTKRLLKKYGYEFENYDEMKEWCERGVEENWDKLSSLYEDNLNLCYARFHGKIVEFIKNVKK